MPSIFLAQQFVRSQAMSSTALAFFVVGRFFKALSVFLFLCFASLSQAGTLTVTVHDSRGKPVPDAVVYLEGKLVVDKHRPVRVEIAQKDKKFVPLINVVQTGSPVFFPNNDTVQHHVYSFSSIKRFELKLYAGTPSTPIVFDQAGTAALGCNIHDSMLAYIHVVDTPLFGKTDALGVFQFKDLVNGDYTIKTWQYQRPFELALQGQTITVKDDGTLKLILPYKLKEWEVPKPDSPFY